MTVGKDVGNYSTSRGVRTWRILAQVITGDFAASQSVPYITYIAHVVTGVLCVEVGICDAHVCSVVFSDSGIVFNPSAGSITDHSQSSKYRDPYFKSQLYVEDPGHRKPVLILLNGLS